jgi:hypothetical protein
MPAQDDVIIEYPGRGHVVTRVVTLSDTPGEATRVEVRGAAGAWRVDISPPDAAVTLLGYNEVEEDAGEDPPWVAVSATVGATIPAGAAQPYARLARFALTSETAEAVVEITVSLL